MTRDLGCSMDYLINESMRHYARSRNYSMAAQSKQAKPEVLSPFSSGAQAQRRPPPPPVAEQAEQPPLYLQFNGERHRIDSDKFTIGRGSQETELTIRDGNISRRHCVVIFRNDSYYIKDLGSTNGVEFEGKRIVNKRIDEGDTFYLCDYELKFTFK